MIIHIFFLFFAYFLKTIGFGSAFQRRNEFCMQKYPNKHIFITFAEKSHLSENFQTGYSLAIFTLSAKKLVSTNLAILGFFPSKKHDSVGITNFGLETFRENHKK